MAYVNIILLSLGFLGIVSGLYLFFRSRKIILAIFLTLLSAVVVFVMLPQLVGSLSFVGVDCRFWPDLGYRGTERMLSHGVDDYMLFTDIFVVAYAAVLIIFGSRAVRARG